MWTTVSTRSQAAARAWASSRLPSTRSMPSGSRARARARERTRARTLKPWRTNASAAWEPTKPVAPVSSRCCGDVACAPSCSRYLPGDISRSNLMRRGAVRQRRRERGVGADGLLDGGEGEVELAAGDDGGRCEGEDVGAGALGEEEDAAAEAVEGDAGGAAGLEDGHALEQAAAAGLADEVEAGGPVGGPLADRVAEVDGAAEESAVVDLVELGEGGGA